MKEAQVAKGLAVTIKDVPVPKPEAEQVVIKVVVSGSNPKDWYVSLLTMSFDSCVSHIALQQVVTYDGNLQSYSRLRSTLGLPMSALSRQGNFSSYAPEGCTLCIA
jgi:hypothetical protein